MLQLLAFVVRAAAAAMRYRRSYDVVIVGDFVLACLALLHRWLDPKARIVILVHGLDVLYGQRLGWLPRLYSLYMRATTAMLRRSDVVILANSSASADAVRSWGLNVASVVPLGVDIPELDRDHSRQRDRKVILFVGRLIPRKGVAWFCKEVLPLLPGARLVVVGPPTDADEVEVVSQADGVEFLGIVSAAELAYQRLRAWIAIVPNQPMSGADIEGFGLTAIESAAAGCVTIGSKVDGLADALVDGVAHRIEPYDARAWADLIKDIQSWDPSRHSEFAARARRTLREKNSWAAVADAVVADQRFSEP